MRILASLLVVLSAHTLFAAECPIKKDETSLTLSRVMYNFRDYLYTPDQVASSGYSSPGSVTNEQLQEAASDASVAVACADAILAKNNPDLVPDDAAVLKGQELADFLQKFYGYITQLHDAFFAYQKSFEQLAKTATAQQDFSTVYDQSMAVRKVENEAHHFFK